MHTNKTEKSNKPKRNRGRNGVVLFLPILMAVFMVILSISLTGCEENTELIPFDEAIDSTQAYSEKGEADSSDEDPDKGLDETSEKRVKDSPEEVYITNETCFVYVCGAVMTPDVYELSKDDHLVDAIRAAGGFTEEAATDYLNLARKVSDGERIYVPTLEEAEALNLQDAAALDDALGETTPMQTGDGAIQEEINGGKSTGLININTADKSSLVTLPGIGDAKAEKIIVYRENNGPFTQISDIMKVDGIKTGAYDKIKDLICVD